MQKQQKKHWSTLYWRKIFFKYFLKYMAGFLLLLAPCILILFVSWQTTRDQVITAGRLRFQEGMSEITSEISKMRILDNDIQSSDAFKTLAQVKGEIPYGQYLNLQTASSQLNQMRYLFNFSPFFFVLFENNELFVSPYQCDERFSEWYYGKWMRAAYSGEVLNASGFRELFFDDTDNVYSFMKLDSFSYYTSAQYAAMEPILCMVNKPHVLRSSSDYCMGYVILPETLIDLLLTEECRENGFVRIVDKDGTVLLNYGSTDMVFENNENITDIGSHWMISATDKTETGWLVQIGIPKTVILEQIHTLYQLIYGYAILGMGLVVTLAYYFSRKQYRDLKNFFSLIPQKAQDISEESHILLQEQPKERDEYKLLMKIFQNMAANSESYLLQKAELERQNQTIRLEKLIVGGINTQEEREELKRSNIICAEFYCVVVARMLVKEEQEYSFALLGLKEYLQENWSSKLFHIHTGVYDELFVFSMSPESEPNVDNVQQLFKDAVRTLSEEIELTLGVGISTIGTDVSNLKRCYTQACQVLEAYYNEEKNAINCYRMESDTSNDTVINMDFLNQMYHYLLHLNAEGMRKSFLLIKSYYHKHPVFFEAQKELYFHSVRSVLYNAMLYFSEKPDENGILPQYDKTDSLDLITEKLQSSAEWLIVQATTHKQIEKEELREEVVEFVEENFANKNMSVSLACSELGVTERYLQTVIKEKTGDTFAVYLEKLRVKCAAELLINTNYSNEQISDEVGFGVISTFYRAFNKRMGMSPKAFRGE